MPEFIATLFTLFAWVLMLIGCVFIVAGGVGLVRFPDLYTRLHAAGVTDTGGSIFMVLAMILISVAQYQNPWIAGKLLLILFFTLFTTPTASHALAKTALLSGLVPKDENGDPIIESPELAQQMALSREPKNGSVVLAPGVNDSTEKNDTADNNKGDGKS